MRRPRERSGNSPASARPPRKTSPSPPPIEQDRPNRFPWPPLLALGAAAAAIALHIALPLPWFGAPFADILFATGWLVVAAGAALDVSAMQTLARAATTIMPHKPSERLVTSGPYSLTRNPIYLGNSLILIGIGLVSGIAWFLLTALLCAFATQKLAIEREERHLEARFGKVFRDYRRRVRRWL